VQILPASALVENWPEGQMPKRMGQFLLRAVRSEALSDPAHRRSAPRVPELRRTTGRRLGRNHSSLLLLAVRSHGQGWPGVRTCYPRRQGGRV